jgi:membrane-associated protease RseP (regulator of RpoE activity)
MLFYLIFTRKSENINELLIAIVFLGGYLFHMVWESSSSYTLPYFVMLIPYAVKGFAEYGKWAENVWLSKRKMPVKAVAVVIVLLLLFTRTSLFARTIALNDGEDAYRQFYQLEDDSE